MKNKESSVTKNKEYNKQSKLDKKNYSSLRKFAPIVYVKGGESVKRILNFSFVVPLKKSLIGRIFSSVI